MLTLLSAVSALAVAGCEFPDATVTVVPVGSEVIPTLGRAGADLSWSVTCAPVTGITCNASVGIQDTLFAATNDILAGRAGGSSYSSLTGAETVTLPGGDCFGCKVYANVGFGCGNGLGTATKSYSSAPVVIPPLLVFPDRAYGVFSYPGTGDFADLPEIVSADAVPAGVPFRLNGLLLTRPRGSERATLRLVGPGLDFSRSYGDDPATTSSDSSDFADAYAKDPTSKAIATAPGTVRAWIEFEGATSPEVTLTVVPAGGAGGGSGGGGGDAAGGGSGGGGDEPTGPLGCAAGAGAPVLLALAALLRRRRR